MDTFRVCSGICMLEGYPCQLLLRLLWIMIRRDLLFRVYLTPAFSLSTAECPSPMKQEYVLHTGSVRAMALCMYVRIVSLHFTISPAGIPILHAVLRVLALRLCR